MTRLHLIPVLLAAVAATHPAPDTTAAGYDDRIPALNARIEAAVAEGREWPRFLDGVGVFLFGSDLFLGQGRIFFRDTNAEDGTQGPWLETRAHRTGDRTWLIDAIRPASPEGVEEALDRSRTRREISISTSQLDYVEQGPLDLLDILRSWPTPVWLAPMMPPGWIEESDVPALIALLDSEEPCANVQSMLSSFIDTTRSTVGREAAYLIAGFRHDHYPPGLNSTRYDLDADEIRRWWKQREAD